MRFLAPPANRAHRHRLHLAASGHTFLAGSSDNAFSGSLHPCLAISCSQEELGHYTVMTPTWEFSAEVCQAETAAQAWLEGYAEIGPTFFLPTRCFPHSLTKTHFAHVDKQDCHRPVVC